MAFNRPQYVEIKFSFFIRRSCGLIPVAQNVNLTTVVIVGDS